VTSNFIIIIIRKTSYHYTNKCLNDEGSPHIGWEGYKFEEDKDIALQQVDDTIAEDMMVEDNLQWMVGHTEAGMMPWVEAEPCMTQWAGLHTAQVD
jgi:hypothetical protein